MTRWAFTKAAIAASPAAAPVVARVVLWAPQAVRILADRAVSRMGALEAGSFFLLWLANGQVFSTTTMQARRAERLSQIKARDSTSYAQVHPYVGFVEDPQANNVILPLAGGEAVHVSDYGYFDDKPPIQKRGPDRVVIGITGGSVACYFTINGSRRLTEDLEKLPRFAGKQLIFVNLALGGYKEPQQLMSAAYLLSLGAEFDLILNIDGFNEVAVNALVSPGDEIFPAYPVGWRSRVALTDANLGLVRSKLLLIDEDRVGLAEILLGSLAILDRLQPRLGAARPPAGPQGSRASGRVWTFPASRQAVLAGRAAPPICHPSRTRRVPGRPLGEQLDPAGPTLPRPRHFLLPFPSAEPVSGRFQADP